VNDPTVFRRDCFKPNCATTLFNQRDINQRDSAVRTSITGIEAAGGHRDTFAGLAGMGDLIVTCTS
jgi:hypothetical protein